MNKNSASRFLPTRHPIYYLSLAFTLALLCLAPHPAMATNRTVTNLNDGGVGSVRNTIAASVDGDTIDFAVTGTITLTSGELVIGRSITITGPAGGMRLGLVEAVTEAQVRPAHFFQYNAESKAPTERKIRPAQ